MTVLADDEVIVLRGRCGVEDAEPLLEALCQQSRPVDLGECEQLHTALVQVLLAARARIVGDSAPLLPDWLGRILGTAETSDNRH